MDPKAQIRNEGLNERNLRAIVNETINKRKMQKESLVQARAKIDELTQLVAKKEAEKTSLRRALIESVDGIDLEAFDDGGKIYTHVKPAIGSEKRYMIQVVD